MNKVKLKHIRLMMILTGALILLIVLGSIALFNRQPPEASTQRIRVGFYQQDAFQEVDLEGRYSGYGYEFIEEIARKNGWDCEYVVDSFDRCLQMLQDGRIDLMGGMIPGGARDEFLLYSAEYEGQDLGAVFTYREDLPDFTDFSDFEGLRVGMDSFDFNADSFLQMAANHGVSVQPVINRDLGALLGSMRDGEIDVVITNTPQKIPGGARMVYRFEMDPFYFAVSQSRPELQAQIDAAITEILSENSQYREHLSDRYYLDDALSWSAMMAVFHTQGAFYAFVTFCALVLMLTLTAFLWQRRQNNRLLRSSEGIIFALEDRQFHLCYQPVVNIETGEVAYLQISAVWQHPEKGLLTSENLFSGCMPEEAVPYLTQWIFKNGIREFSELLRQENMYRAKLLFEIPLPMNLHQYHDTDELLRRYLARYHLPHECICLLVSGRAFTSKPPVLRRTLRRIRRGRYCAMVGSLPLDARYLELLNDYGCECYYLGSALVEPLLSGEIAPALREFQMNLPGGVVVAGIRTVSEIDLCCAMGFPLLQGPAIAQPQPFHLAEHYWYHGGAPAGSEAAPSAP